MRVLVACQVRWLVSALVVDPAQRAWRLAECAGRVLNRRKRKNNRIWVDPFAFIERQVSDKIAVITNLLTNRVTLVENITTL